MSIFLFFLFSLLLCFLTLLFSLLFVNNFFLFLLSLPFAEYFCHFNFFLLFAAYFFYYFFLSKVGIRILINCKILILFSQVPTTMGNGHAAVNGTHNLLISTSSSSSSNSSATSPLHEKNANLPSTVPEVMRTASERHQKGLMSPYIYQILTAGEIKLPVLLEDENNREFPSIHLIYRPVRQMVYAILFNVHHRIYLANKSKEKGGEFIFPFSFLVKIFKKNRKRKYFLFLFSVTFLWLLFIFFYLIDIFFFQILTKLNYQTWLLRNGFGRKRILTNIQSW